MSAPCIEKEKGPPGGGGEGVFLLKRSVERLKAVWRATKGVCP